MADINNAISGAAGRSMDAISRQMSLCSAAVQQHFNTYSQLGNSHPQAGAQQAALAAMHRQLHSTQAPHAPVGLTPASGAFASCSTLTALSGASSAINNGMAPPPAKASNTNSSTAALSPMPHPSLATPPAYSLQHLVPNRAAPTSPYSMHHLALLHQQQHYVHAMGLSPAEAAMMAAAAAGGPNGAGGMTPQQQLAAMANHAAHLCCRLPAAAPMLPAAALLQQYAAAQQQQQQQACMAYQQYQTGQMSLI